MMRVVDMIALRLRRSEILIFLLSLEQKQTSQFDFRVSSEQSGALACSHASVSRPAIDPTAEIFISSENSSAE